MKPTPKVVSTICTVCDEPWEDHGDKPTVADCIRLLKRHRGSVTITPTPWIPTYPSPPAPKVWYSTITPNTTAAPLAINAASTAPDVYELAAERLQDG